MFSWATLFALVYTIFCKKHEQKLIQQKIEELDRLQQNRNENESTSTKSSQVPAEFYNRDYKKDENGKRRPEIEIFQHQWIGQVAGMTRL